MRKSKVTRRRFLKTAAQIGAAAAMPTIVPASVLGRNGSVPPSEKILAAGIGIQGRGTGDMHWLIGQPDVRVVAICDIQKKQRERIKAFVDGRYGSQDCAMYSDIREFLAERTDVDAVLIATGDRWHALASILSMRAGKDVYTE